MKTLFRILIILVVASLIGGAIFAAVNGNGSASQRSSFQRPEGDRPHPEGDHEGHDGGFGLPFGVFKSFAVISIIAVVYLNGTKWFSKVKGENKQIEV